MSRTGIIITAVGAALVLALIAVLQLGGDGSGAAAPDDAVEVVFSESELTREIYELPIRSEERQDVSLVVRNQDVGRSHGIGIYPEQDGEALIDQPIVESDPIEGQAQRVISFSAPEEPGTYTMRCTVHTDEVATVRFVDPDAEQ
ncbi:MAG: hypothetical protein KY437_04865 [Actinobacteria bacterium]|nr:hypothetical protein [Actinomycetota bacterium]